MSLIWKGIRAVTMETFGVVAVVWMLFAAGGWTMESAGVQPKDEARRAWRWASHAANDMKVSLTPSLSEEERLRYVEEQLEHYSQVYRQSASDYLRHSVSANEASSMKQPADLRQGELLGSL